MQAAIHTVGSDSAVHEKNYNLSITVAIKVGRSGACRPCQTPGGIVYGQDFASVEPTDDSEDRRIVPFVRVRYESDVGIIERIDSTIAIVVVRLQHDRQRFDLRKARMRLC